MTVIIYGIGDCPLLPGDVELWLEILVESGLEVLLGGGGAFKSALECDFDLFPVEVRPESEGSDEDIFVLLPSVGMTCWHAGSWFCCGGPLMRVVWWWSGDCDVRGGGREKEDVRELKFYIITFCAASVTVNDPSCNVSSSSSPFQIGLFCCYGFCAVQRS
ncbi:uncharacterized protein CIMG_12741 [Coccidioides immitis RS]|uniref:Uncharacterized protein n=1 Tax=Coccidioides immitis (strain RS) TaxID=246410 RepID=A0A0D8JSH5_COCIM|nr:uncharacterized protein CIMG_12741 [Coccidioides immitis RS]KJF60094.1 hypothetical protein CIMG_12741 [Coccidioides immitis RS]